MDFRLQTIPQKKLIGKSILMSLTNNRTGELWASFMPRRKDIPNQVSPDLYSLQVYSPDYFRGFNPSREFTKWALVEVSSHNGTLPDGFEPFTLEGGRYAVFNYKGPGGNPRPFQYIYTEWLPASGYALDDKPHFELLGEKYRNNDPESEEEIWVPVREKA